MKITRKLHVRECKKLINLLNIYDVGLSVTVYVRKYL